MFTLKKEKFKNKYFLGFLSLLLIFWGVSLWNFFHFKDNIFVGNIVQIESGMLLIDDAKDGENWIHFSEQTPIYGEKKQKELLSVGKEVFIQTQSQSGTLIADFIKILGPKKDAGNSEK